MGGGVADEGTMVERGFDVKSNDVRARGPCRAGRRTENPLKYVVQGTGRRVFGVAG